MPNILSRSFAFPFFGILLLAAIVFGLFQIPGIVKSRLEQKLHLGGFPLARVDSASLMPSSIRAENVKLDQYGFDEIKSLQADINWSSFLTRGDVSGLTISGVHLGRDATNIGPGLRKMMGQLLLLPDYRISITDATMDVTTDFGELRVTGEATIDIDPSTSNRIIKARILSSQYQLGFDSTWNGTLGANGDLDLSAELVEGRLNIGPLRISRFNGWIGTAVTGGQHSMESQMEAGSATFMDVPIQNLSLVSTYAGGESNLIFRSGISGMPDILFTADLLRNEQSQSFEAVLAGGHLGMFLDYIEEATGHSKNIRDTLLKAGPFRFATRFEPEKRFVGGPLPFAITLETDGAKSMEGNVLFYPDTLDVRGSLETDNDMALAMQDYFKIPSTNMRQNFIRLDGDIRRFFFFGEPPATATGTDPTLAPPVLGAPEPAPSVIP